jgi:hypothetical protein
VAKVQMLHKAVASSLEAQEREKFSGQPRKQNCWTWKNTMGNLTRFKMIDLKDRVLLPAQLDAFRASNIEIIFAHRYRRVRCSVCDPNHTSLEEDEQLVTYEELQSGFSYSH